MCTHVDDEILQILHAIITSFFLSEHRYDTSAKQRTPSWTDRIMWRENPDQSPQKIAQTVTPCTYWSASSETSSDHRAVGASFQLHVSSITAPTASPPILTPILITNPGMGQLATTAVNAIGSNVTWAMGTMSTNVKRVSLSLSEAFVPGSTADTTIAAFTCRPGGNIFSEGRPGALAVMEHEVKFTSIGSKQSHSIPYSKIKSIAVGSGWNNGIVIHVADAAPFELKDFNMLGLGQYSGNQRRHAVRLIKSQAAKVGIEVVADAKLWE
jgi:hypothetical protein